MNELIRVEDMYKVYNPGENEVRALDGVSLTIEQGEFAAIIGHSGSGKSTLMNMLGCLDTPTAGSYYLNGRDVSQMSDNEISDIRNQEIGFIFQGYNLIANLDARSNVELPLVYRGIDKRKRRKIAEEALNMVGLYDRIHHKPAQMSGGQQQRVAVARAIAARPPIIFADEPTGNLDSHTSEEVMQLMQKVVREQKKTLVMVTHDNHLATYADRIFHISDGKIIKIEENDRTREDKDNE